MGSGMKTLAEGRLQQCPSVQKRIPGTDVVMHLTVVKVDGKDCYITAEIVKFMEEQTITVGIGKYTNAKQGFGDGIFSEAFEKPVLKTLKSYIGKQSPYLSKSRKLYVVQVE
jgi:hypothetical protein